MNSQRSTTSTAGTPEGQAALVALASTLRIDPKILRPILENAFDKVQSGLTPVVALKRSLPMITVDSSAATAASERPIQTHLPSPNPSARNITAQILAPPNLAPENHTPQNLACQILPSSPTSNLHHELLDVQIVNRNYELLRIQPYTVPGYWPADFDPTLAPSPPPPMGLANSEQMSTGTPYPMPFANQARFLNGPGAYRSPPKGRNWFWSDGRTDSIEE
ncbi:hypothetical protein T440DRAFT_532526 [Plenodomus tracheiphilus IPT5]|uniref:Uncharacterized protein n=1 Tax=Plenodomus tracheiphilus IPT5 TaxID=1408161 RepID=A0A6A7B755_9PLEO|nr:hypothetical protein T440DRAFT_532526 [Plenodomus tracheiphilus IPT5]